MFDPEKKKVKNVLWCNHRLWQRRVCSEICTRFHKAAGTVKSKLKGFTKCHGHRSSSLESHRFDQRCSESSERVAIGQKHQLPRRGDKYTPVDPLVVSMATACNDDAAQTNVLWLKGKQNREVWVEPCFLTVSCFSWVSHRRFKAFWSCQDWPPPWLWFCFFVCFGRAWKRIMAKLSYSYFPWTDTLPETRFGPREKTTCGNTQSVCILWLENCKNTLLWYSTLLARLRPFIRNLLGCRMRSRSSKTTCICTATYAL